MSLNAHLLEPILLPYLWSVLLDHDHLRELGDHAIRPSPRDADLTMLAVDAPGVPPESLPLHSTATAHLTGTPLGFMSSQARPLRAVVARPQALHVR